MVNFIEFCGMKCFVCLFFSGKKSIMNDWGIFKDTSSGNMGVGKGSGGVCVCEK